MTTIQNAFLLYSMLEKHLKVAAQENIPISVRDMWEVSDVKNVATGMQQVRDYLITLERKQMTLRKQFDTPHRGSSFGYIWNVNSRIPIEQIAKKSTGHRVLSRKSSDVKILDVETLKEKVVTKKQKEIELVFNGIAIVVNHNEATGRIRITFDI